MNTNMRKTMYCKHCGHETDYLTMGYCDACYYKLFYLPDMAADRDAEDAYDESRDDDQAMRRAGSVTPKPRMTP